jgi:hypothetical protein
MHSFKNDGSFLLGKGSVNNNTSTKSFNVVIGENSKIGTSAGAYNEALAIGYNANGGASRSTTVGPSAIGTGATSTALGYSSLATGTNAIAIRGNASVSGAIAIGSSAQATGNNNSVAIGSGANSSNNKAISLGNNAIASGSNSQALGYSAQATGTQALALGRDTRSLAAQGVTVGCHLEVNHSNAIIIGSGVNNTAGNRLESTAINQLVVGFDSITPFMVLGEAVGSYINSADLIIGGSSKIGTEDISLQGDTLINGVLDMNNNRITKTIVNPSVQETTSTATLTINADQQNTGVLTAQGAALTVANPTGTIVQGQKLVYRIKDDGTGRAITWGADFRAIGVTLPTTTTASKLKEEA